MHGQYIYFTDQAMSIYLSKHTSDWRHGRAYEVFCSLLIKLYFEKQFNTKCLTGFKIKSNLAKDFSLTANNVEDLEEFQKIYADTDTDIDFSVFPINTYNEKINRNKAWGFQLKRFGHFHAKQDTGGLIDYLKDIKKKYSKSLTNLVLFLDGNERISLNKICNHEDLKDFPFHTIMYVSIYPASDKNPVGIEMGYMWPIFGHNVFDAKDALKKFKLTPIKL